MQLQVETQIYKKDAIGNDVAEAGTKATNYIVDLNNGISVHPAGNVVDRVEITSDGTEIYQNGNSVAEYGATARIGKEDGSRFLIGADRLQAYNNIDPDHPYFEVSSEGLRYGTASETKTVASTDYVTTYVPDYVENIISGTGGLQEYIDNNLEELQKQVDGAIDTWYYAADPTLTNEPANNWTTLELKESHLRDLYFNTTNGHTSRWAVFQTSDTEIAFDKVYYTYDNETGVYTLVTEPIATNLPQYYEFNWVLIEDSDALTALGDAARAQNTADGKRRVFITQPTNAEAYDIGDLWVNATYNELYTNEVLRCQIPKLAGDAFNINHWVKASKYTDDSNLLAYQRDVETRYATKTEVTNTTEAFERNISRLAVKTAGMYAISNTLATDLAKEAIITPSLSVDEVWELTKGTLITVKFINANTATPSDAIPLTLQINDTDPIEIRNYMGDSLTEEEYEWSAGATFTFIYDNTYWLMQDSTIAVQIKENKTQIEQTADNVLIKASQSGATEAEKAAGGASVIQSLINVAPEGVTIDADKVEINGTAIFSAIENDINAAISSAIEDIDIPEMPDTSGFATKDSTIIATQRIYYRSKTNEPPSGNGLPPDNTWINNNENIWNENSTTSTSQTDNLKTGWTTKITPLGKYDAVSGQTIKYLYLWTCIQWKTADNHVYYGTILLDESTTVIDGGNIITGSIDANKISVNKLSALAANMGILDAGRIQSGNPESSGFVFLSASDYGTYIITNDNSPNNNKKYYIYDAETNEYTDFLGNSFDDNITYYELVNPLDNQIQVSPTTIANGKQKTDWRFIVGNNLGIDKDGILYGSNVKLQGEVEASKFNIVNSAEEYYITKDIIYDDSKTYYILDNDEYIEFDGNSFSEGVTYYEYGFINHTYMSADSNGIIIGDADKFHLEATATKLGFFDNQTEVAYINDNSLFINKSVVVKQMDVGYKDGEKIPSSSSGELGHGQWSWKVHLNGESTPRNNLYLKWMG